MSEQISLIIATFGKKNIVNFISSLQTAGVLPNDQIEIIIADNNHLSSDSNWVENFCKENGLVHVPSPQYGKANALNKAILRTSFETIVFTDDKTTITDKNWLNKLTSPFAIHPHLGWVSGNVFPTNLDNKWNRMWEEKGGLSKGKKDIYWSQDFLKNPDNQPILYFKMCAGANSAFRKQVFRNTGPWNILLDSGSRIGAGSTSEFGYRITQKGYELSYVNDCFVNHPHPDSAQEIKRKLFIYGRGDAAQYFSLFLRFGDKLMLYQALIGHLAYTLKKFKLRLEGKYSLPLGFLLFSVYGILTGPIIYLWEYLKKRKLLIAYEKDFLDKIK
jgi:GT2 family glycosyltransferase